MLRSSKDLHAYRVIATDGEVGSVYDFYFDDEAWVVRYLVVDTGKWLPGRLVLISPISINQPDWESRSLPVALTREQVKQSPPIETHRPLSRQQEAEFSDYYGYPYYWTGNSPWGAAPYPIGPAVAPTSPAGPLSEAETGYVGDSSVQEAPEDRHLRSSREVMGYHLQAVDGELGHLEEFLLDDLTWGIRYAVVDTGPWWSGRNVLIPPAWIEQVDWVRRSVTVDVSREAVRQAPQYDAVAHVTRQWETDYYAHYRRVPYWISEEEARRIAAAREREARS